MMKSDRNACTTRIAANAQRAQVLNASACLPLMQVC